MANDIDNLIDMGFHPIKVQKAWKATKGAGLQPAMDWLLSHPEVTDEPDNESAEQDQMIAEDAASQKPAEDAAPPITAVDDDGEIKDGDQNAQSLLCNNCQKLFRNAVFAERHAIKTGHQDFSESKESVKSLTAEETLQKLAELKQKREMQEKADQKEREQLRRKAGKDVSDIQEMRKDKEMKESYAARKREKKQDKDALAKVKAQIEADKRERRAKAQAKEDGTATVPPQVAQPAEPVVRVKKEHTDARLQIRGPDAPPLINTFSATDTLDSVFEFLQSKGIVRPCSLSTQYPRKIFGEEDRSKTLKELGLVPSASLILLYN